jgi:predicted HicB family RNase H-like nuclease
MTSFSHKQLEIKHAVEKLFATKPDWMKFYREVMGLHGLIRRAFPTFEVMAEFEQTETYRETHRMLAELRKLPPPKELAEDTKVITVRIPQSLHEALRIEAYEHHTTMNKLCISKLVQFIDTENVPTVFEDRKPVAEEEEEEQEAEAGL